MAGLRVKGPRPGYRRAGQVFGPDWTEVPAEVVRTAGLALLGDAALVIQAADDKGGWVTVSADDRARAIETYRREPVGGGPAEPAAPPAEIAPAILVDAQLGQDLRDTIDLHREMLEGRGLWPVTVPQALFLSFAGLLGTAEGDVERLTAELAAAQTITPASDGQDGGGGAPAAPAAASPPAAPKPAATAGGGPAPKPASKPKPAEGKKPAASKAS